MFEIPDGDDDLWNDDWFEPFAKMQGKNGSEIKVKENPRHTPVLDNECLSASSSDKNNRSALATNMSNNQQPKISANKPGPNIILNELPSKTAAAGDILNLSTNIVSNTKAAGGSLCLQSGDSSNQLTNQSSHNMCINIRQVPAGSNEESEVFANIFPLPSKSVVDLKTPNRKRKFPGPAGILPKLSSGQCLDALSPSILANQRVSPEISKSPTEESCPVLSQTSEDVFVDTPWQSLMRDLGTEAPRLLNKFSIAATQLLAGKKQLVNGKAALVFGVIDMVESHGAEASITIRDPSGRMHGTVHRDLLKDHEAEMQTGTCLVLKQVSIISVGSRKHYLNITPNNLVSVYQTRQGELTSRHFHSSQDSLYSVLAALEAKAASEQSSLNNSLTGTPQSSSGRSRLSSTGTPQLTGRLPTTPQLNQLFSGPGYRTPNSGYNTPVYNNSAPNSRSGTPLVGQMVNGQKTFNSETKSILTQTSHRGQNINTDTPIPSSKLGFDFKSKESFSNGENTNASNLYSGQNQNTAANVGNRQETNCPRNNDASKRNVSNCDSGRSQTNSNLLITSVVTAGKVLGGFQNKLSIDNISCSMRSDTEKFLGTSNTDLQNIGNTFLNSRLTVGKAVNIQSAKGDGKTMDIQSAKSDGKTVDIQSAKSDTFSFTRACDLHSSTPNVSNRGRWKFRSPSYQNVSLPNSPNVGINQSCSNQDLSFAKSKLDDNSRLIPEIPARNQGQRNCQLSAVAPNTNTQNTQITLSPIEVSDCIFKAKKLRSDAAVPNSRLANPVTSASTTKVGKSATEDPLWDDDLNEDMLSQLSEDF
ncbi:uncharacterized protein LOC127877547 isoform X2 [Dreissena polymorpha]|uniref:uncharacterized protein LOC127877547 isoform X2 n=1 Tax=Dreissena polymorpha TaxID=45954 RepID=UPI00226487F1|nr:uncharacterized protein LOC127877547 isoform X2 [Dreissena polymorpha]